MRVFITGESRYFNIQAAKEGLHWEPRVTLAEGLNKTLQYYENRV